MRTDVAVPESPATLAAQRRELIEGKRPLVVYKGGEHRLATPKGMRDFLLGRDVAQYNPKKTSETEIRRAAQNDTLGKLLRLGPVSKNEAIARAHRGETPVAVVERSRNGTELRTAAGTHGTAPAQLKYFEGTKSHGGHVSVESPSHVLAHRLAGGGPVTDALSMGMHIAGKPVHVGPIRSAVAGRTDHIPRTVPGGAYVIPADIVSGIGEGNTEAGFNNLDRTFGKMIGQGPTGMKLQRIKVSKVPHKAAGGPVDIMAAGGEYTVPPHVVAHIGGGDMKKGHEELDKFVKLHRAELIKTLRKLPGPKKS